MKSLRDWRPGALARGSVWIFSAQAGRVTILAFYLLLLTRLLGISAYGNLAAPLSLAVIVGTFSTGGLTLIMLRDVARDESTLGEAWIRFLLIYRWSAPIGLLIFALLHWLMFGERFERWIVPLAIAEILVMPWISAAVSAAQACERYRITSVLITLSPLARLAAASVLLIVPSEMRLLVYCWLHLATITAAGIGIYAVSGHRCFQKQLLRVPLLGRDAWRDVFAFSLLALVASASIDLDKSLAMRFADAHVAGLYNASYRVMAIFSMPSVAIAQSVLPRLTRIVSNDLESARKLLRLATLVSIIMGGMAAVMLVISGPWILMLLGEAFQEASIALPGLAIVLFLFCVRIVPSVMLQAQERPMWRAGLEAIAVLIILIGGSILIPRFALNGVVMAAILSEAWILLASWIAVLSILSKRNNRDKRI